MKKAKKSKAKKAKAPTGCCTLTGSGPAEQYEGLTEEQCRLLAIQKDKNDHWWAGKCAKTFDKSELVAKFQSITKSLD